MLVWVNRGILGIWECDAVYSSSRHIAEPHPSSRRSDKVTVKISSYRTITAPHISARPPLPSPSPFPFPALQSQSHPHLHHKYHDPTKLIPSPPIPNFPSFALKIISASLSQSASPALRRKGVESGAFHALPVLGGPIR